MGNTMLDIPIGKWRAERPGCSKASHDWTKHAVSDGEHPNVVDIGGNTKRIFMKCADCGTYRIKSVERDDDGALVSITDLYSSG